jgi:[protein-PII] uridylyltransferase
MTSDVEPTAAGGSTIPGGVRASQRRRRSDEMDARLRQLFGASGAGDSLALVGVGGYGRGELSPRSDLDVVLLHEPGVKESTLEQVADAIWYPLWDTGVDLDHAVRSTREMRRMAAQDLRAAVGMLDLRHVAGNAGLSASLRSQTLDDWRRGARTRLPELRATGRERAEKAGDLAHAAIPDLKESHGGLRDGVVLRALVATWLVDVPHVETEACRSALLDVRDALHEVAGRATDRLAPELVPEIAQLLGTTPPALSRHVRLLGRRTGHLAQATWRRVDQLEAPVRVPGLRRRTRRPQLVRLEDGVARVGDEVVLAPGARPETDPALSLRVGALAAEHQLQVAPSTAARLARTAGDLPEPWPSQARRSLVALLSAGRSLVPVWEELEHAGVVGRWLPEWEGVVCLPSEAVVHRFTVDRHSLEACVEAASRVRDVGRPDLLVVAALLHDLGKALPGDHSEVGAAMARATALRIGFADEDAETVARLVELHLYLPEIATRRDLDDPATADAAAARIGDADTLDLLAALTESDARAASPQAWSAWRASLVRRLVAQCRARLHSDAAEPAGAPLGPPQEVVTVSGHAVHVGVVATGDGSHVWVAGDDRVGLLADVAGTLAWAGLTVRGLRAVADGAHGLRSEWDVTAAWLDLPALVLRMRRVLDRSVDLTERLPPVPDPSEAPPRVDVLDTASTGATVLQLRAGDRRGLLWRVFSTLAADGIDVRSAHVDTLGSQAVDVLYLVDANGSPLEPAATERLVRSLTTALG